MSIESEAINYLLSTDGWRVLEHEIKQEFEKEYKKLRKCNRDSAFYKIQGKLEGLEFVLTRPDIIKTRGELT
jgi:hypothetical protein